jgi:ligand-binding sensor domain-containing protein
MLIGTTGGGMFELDPRSGAKLPSPSEPTGLSASAINAIVETEPGIVWIGTANGLERLDRRSGKFDHFTEADGLPGSTVNGIVADGTGQLWLSGDRGIVRFNPATKRSKSYTVADGLQGSEFNSASYYRAKDGTILFGGSQGFNLLEPITSPRNAHVPAVAVTGFQLFNKPVAIGAKDSPLEQSITRPPEQ